jgi:hypothetical protein
MVSKSAETICVAIALLIEHGRQHPVLQSDLATKLTTPGSFSKLRWLVGHSSHI